jgi:hypothetical protein
MTLFGVLKQCPRYEPPFDDNHATVNAIMKIYHAFTQTTGPSNVWGAFLALAFVFDTRMEPYWLVFDEKTMRGSARFQELWCVNFVLDQLSDRRRSARFGWISKPE